MIINRSRHQEDRRITFRDYLGYRNYELSSSHIIERYEHRKTGSAGQASISSIVTQIFIFFSRKSYPNISYIFFPNKRLRSLNLFTHIPLSCNMKIVNDCIDVIVCNKIISLSISKIREDVIRYEFI